MSPSEYLWIYLHTNNPEYWELKESVFVCVSTGVTQKFNGAMLDKLL